MTEDKMVGWYHQFNGHKFEQTPEDDEGKEAWCAAVQRVGHYWVIEQQPTLPKIYEHNLKLVNLTIVGYDSAHISWKYVKNSNFTH